MTGEPLDLDARPEFPTPEEWGWMTRAQRIDCCRLLLRDALDEEDTANVVGYFSDRLTRALNITTCIDVPSTDRRRKARRQNRGRRADD